jgi:hypothetical protein
MRRSELWTALRCLAPFGLALLLVRAAAKTHNCKRSVYGLVRHSRGAAPCFATLGAVATPKALSNTLGKSTRQEAPFVRLEALSINACVVRYAPQELGGLSVGTWNLALVLQGVGQVWSCDVALEAGENSVSPPACSGALSSPIPLPSPVSIPTPTIGLETAPT